MSDFITQLFDFIMHFINAIKDLVASVSGKETKKETTKAPSETDSVA